MCFDKSLFVAKIGIFLTIFQEKKDERIEKKNRMYVSKLTRRSVCITRPTIQYIENRSEMSHGHIRVSKYRGKWRSDLCQTSANTKEVTFVSFSKSVKRDGTYYTSTNHSLHLLFKSSWTDNFGQDSSTRTERTSWPPVWDQEEKTDSSSTTSVFRQSILIVQWPFYRQPWRSLLGLL